MSLYHFVALNQNSFQKVVLAKRQCVNLQLSQCLQPFQIEALSFLDKFVSINEFAIYNDESGLGKTAVVSVLLGTIGKNKKTLIVVQNGDEFVNNWLFHLNILSGLLVSTINGVADSTDSPHHVYVAKWTTIRTIGDLSRFKFDWIIVDNKGNTLNNNFCYSMLVKNFERKVNLLISSSDVTSDVKFLHKILRLGGRLDPQFEDYKVFLEKFKLPDGHEIGKNKVDIEVYYGKRAMLCDLINKFRLRRYKHQYEAVLPLVDPDQYNFHLQQWLEVQKSKETTVHTIESSDSTVNGGTCYRTGNNEVMSLSQRNKHLKKLCGILNKNDPTPSQLQFESSETPEETELMSPLLVLSSESENETENDFNFTDSEIFCPPLDPEVFTNETTNLLDQNSNQKNNIDREMTKEANEEQRRKSNPSIRCVFPLLFDKSPSPENLNEIQNKLKSVSNKRKSFELNQPDDNIDNDNGVSSSSGKEIKDLPTIVISDSEEDNLNIDIEPSDNKKQNDEKKEEEEAKNPKKKIKLEKPEFTFRETRGTRWSRTTRSASNQGKTHITNFALSYENGKRKRRSAPPKLGGGDKHLKTEEKKGKDNRNSLGSGKNQEDGKHQDDKENNNQKTPIVKQTKDSKLSDTSNTLNSQQKSPQKKKQTADNQKKIANKKEFSENKNSPEKNTVKNKLSSSSKEAAVHAAHNDNQAASQTNIISSSSSYEDIQCGQRLDMHSDIIAPNSKNSGEFLVPSSRPLTNLTIYNDSDPIIISPSNTTSNKKNDIVVLSSSPESSVSSSTCEFSRRTLALKPNKVADKRAPLYRPLPATRAFTQINDHHSRNKSPDLFSTCSEINGLPCTPSTSAAAARSSIGIAPNTTETNQPFGFKIFGSEVKEFQQQYADRESSSNNLRAAARKNTRSCLNILENMFDPATIRINSNSTSTVKESNKGKRSSATNSMRKSAERTSKRKKSETPIVPTHPINAIEKDNAKKALEKAAKEAKIKAQSEAKQQKKNSSTSKKSLEKKKPNQEDSLKKCTGKNTDPSGKSSLIESSNDDIFEITNNTTFGPRLRLESTGEVVPLQNQPSIQANPNQKSKQNNKITNYFSGNQFQQGAAASNKILNTPPGDNQEMEQDQQQNTPSKRPGSSNSKKSPKGNKTPTQVTKLTRWLTKNGNNVEEPTQALAKKSPFKKAVEINMALQQAGGGTKAKITRRRRLDMSKP